MSTKTTVVSKFPQIIALLPARMDALTKALAEKVEHDAKQRVPDRPPIGEGLVAAIHVERQGLGEYSVVAGDDEVFYGHIVEHGSVHSAPHPFLLPALEANKDVAHELAVLALKGIV